MASVLETKITISAQDKASPVISKVGAALDKLQKAGKGIGNAFNNLGSAASDFGARLAKIGIVAGLAGGALFALAKAQGQYAERIGIISQKTGISTDTLQKWSYVASLSNLQLEDMVVGFRGLSKTMAAASINPKDDMAKWFKKNKIAIKDAKGQLLPLEQVFGNITEVFKNAPDGAAKMATAMKLFGRAGMNLIPILNLGKEGFAGLMKKANLKGLVIPPEVLKAQQAFDDHLDDLHASILGLKMAIGSKLIPIFQPMALAMENWIDQNRELISTKVGAFATELGAGFTIVAKTLYAVGSALAPVVEAMGGLRTVIAAIAFVYIGGLVMSFGRLLASLVMIAPALWTGAAAMWGFLAPMLIAAAPVLAVVAAVAALAAAAYLIYQNWGAFKAFWANLWAGIPDSVKTAMRVVAAIVTAGLSEVGIAIFQNFEAIKAKVQAMIDSLKGMGESVKNIFNGKAIGGGLYNWMHPEAKNATAPTTVDMSGALGKTDQAVSSIAGGAKEAQAATSGMGEAFKTAGVATITAISPVLGILAQVVAAVNNIKSALQSMSANPIKIGVQTTGVPSGAVTPAAGVAAKPAVVPGKSAMVNTPQTGALASNTRTKLDVYMKIDSEGKAKNVRAKASHPMDFAANTGVMV